MCEYFGLPFPGGGASLVLLKLHFPNPTLLHELSDRDMAASLPAPAYTLKQSSSHDPRKTDPANAEGWHSNNDRDNAIRTEVNEGRNEWVIMEDKGPGAVVWYWPPLAENKGAVPSKPQGDQIIR